MYCKKCGTKLELNETELNDLTMGVFEVITYYDCHECDKTYIYKSETQVEYEGEAM